MKKIISFVLAAVLLVSAVPMAFAAETQDYSLGTAVVYTANDEANENWTVTVPAQLAPGTGGTVTLDGYWPSTKIITVTAQESVKLTNSINANDTKTLAVDFKNGISAAGNNTEKQTFTETVSVEAITDALFGTWSGHFYYNVDSKTEYIELSSEDDIYALARILSLDSTKTAFYGSDYSVEDDLNRFEYPNTTLDNSEKIEYLSTAEYKLTSDVSLTVQRTNDTTFFIGIGSGDYPFKGTFNGNGKTVTLLSNGDIAFNANMTPSLGFIGRATDAKIINTNINIEDDLIVNRCHQRLSIGPLVGKAQNCEITNCNVTISDSNIGSDYADGETYVSQVYVGGIVGESIKSTIKDCTVTMTDSTLQAKGYDVITGTMYADFSVGGILGFSRPGSDNVDNTEDVGIVGNQLINCKVISNNTSQRDVIIASIRNGEEITTGGLVGCTFNNFVAKDCAVQISKGNIVAQKTGTSDSTLYGTNAGGIIGRLEHTGELFNCSVQGDYLSIISKSPENNSTAGGIVGRDLGPYHREVISINKCSFDGSGTSKIILEITADDTVNDWNAMGGIVGNGTYQIKDCSVKDVTLVNQSENVRGFVGGICGLYDKYTGLWASGQFFTPKTPEIINCTSNGVVFDVTSNISTHEIYAFAQ